MAKILLVVLSVLFPATLAAQPAEIPITIADGQVTASGLLDEPGGPILRLPLGDPVMLVIETDATLALHLHGYETELLVHPGAVGRLEVAADRTGRFPLTVHASEHGVLDHGHAYTVQHSTLLYLEIVPP